jgi:phage terminase small subunit
MSKPKDSQPGPPPPEHLSEKSKTLWSSVVPSRGKSLGRLGLVTVALEALDRADEACAEIKRTGLTTITEKSGACHINPLLKLEKESRQMFAKIWVQLRLHLDPLFG